MIGKGGDIMKIRTNDGFIFIEAEYSSEERCIMDGYELAFIDPKYGPVYVCEGSYAIISGW